MAYAPVDKINRDYEGKIAFDKWTLRIDQGSDERRGDSQQPRVLSRVLAGFF